MGFKVLKAIRKFNERKANYNSVKQEATQSRIVSLLNQDTNFTISEAYKALRTNIIFALGDKGDACKKIIITSASPGEGKTTTCLNLAIAFAQTGSKVLVIGADMRKPRAYRHLQIERKNGLSDVLCGLATLDQAIKHCAPQGIDCITSGQIPPNPMELLSSAKMGEILDELSKKYDYMFIDTPPVSMVADATALSKYVDGVIVIARQNYTIHETLERARDSLEFAEAKILGYVLNDVDILSDRYGAYKRYGYIRGMINHSYSGYNSGYGYYGYGYEYGYGYGYGYGYSGRKTEIDAETAYSNLDGEVKFVGEDTTYGDEERHMEEVIEEKLEESLSSSKKNKKSKK